MRHQLMSTFHLPRSVVYIVG